MMMYDYDVIIIIVREEVKDGPFLDLAACCSAQLLPEYVRRYRYLLLWTCSGFIPLIIPCSVLWYDSPMYVDLHQIPPTHAPPPRAVNTQSNNKKGYGATMMTNNVVNNINSYPTLITEPDAIQDYRRVMARFMSWKHGKPVSCGANGLTFTAGDAHPANHTFTTEQMLEITPEDIRKWMCLMAYHTENPSREDCPNYATKILSTTQRRHFHISWFIQVFHGIM